MDQPTRIAITTDTFLRALVVGAVAFAVWTLHDLVLLVLTAIVIASAIEPGVLFFVKHRIPRVLAVLGMYVAVFGSIFTTVYVFFPPILDDMQGLVATVPQYLDTLNLPTSITSIGQTAPVGESGEGSLVSKIFAFRSAFSDTGEGALLLMSAFFGGIFALGLVVVLSFYFAIQETGIDDFLRIITPAKNEEYVVNLWLRAKKKIGLWMQGQLLSSLIGGIIAYLGLLILGVPYAILLALFTAAAMLVPIFGSFLSAVPAIVIAFGAGGYAINDVMAGARLKTSNAAYQALLKDANNTSALETLKAKNPKLYQMFIFETALAKGDVEALKSVSLSKENPILADLATYQLSQLDANATPKGELLSGMVLLQEGYELLKEKKVEEARLKFAQIEASSPLKQIAKNLEHYQGLK